MNTFDDEFDDDAVDDSDPSAESVRIPAGNSESNIEGDDDAEPEGTDLTGGSIDEEDTGALDPTGATQPGGLEEALVGKMRLKRFAPATERSYVRWYKAYVHFHRLRHPAEMAKSEIEAFLTHQARNRKVARSTQNQAFSALLFLYRHVLHIELEGIDALRAKERKKIPVVLRLSFPALVSASARRRLRGARLWRRWDFP